MLPYVDIPFQYLSDIVGSSIDELKLLAVFLLSYPLAGVLKRLPENKPDLKNIFSISVAVFYLVGLFDLWGGLTVVLIDAVGTYLIAKYVQGPLMPWIGFVFLMVHMSISHVYRLIEDDSTVVDITGAQMVLVMKLSAFCWNVYDGRQKFSELNDMQKDRAVTKLPSLLNYAGFVAFFPSLMIGPAFDYVDYERWINLTMFDVASGTDPTKVPPLRKRRRIPRSSTTAILTMVTGLVWLVLFLQLSPYYNSGVVLGDSRKRNFFLRVYHLHMLSFVQRMKYYAVWTLTEGSCILSGIAYNGVNSKTGKPDWGGLTNIKPLGVEMAQNTHAYLGNWNINTNHWLRNYIYLRVTPKGKKPGFRATMATFITSAVWHGFAPGYYLTFVFASFIQNIAKNCRRLIRPFFMTSDGSKPTKYKPYYDVLTWLATQLTFSFTTAPFILLTLEDSLQAWAGVYFYSIITVLLGNLLLLTPIKPWLVNKVKARSKKPSLQRTESQESDKGPMLGVPADPSEEIDEIVDEIIAEVKRRRANQTGPDDHELQKMVKEKVNQKMQPANGTSPTDNLTTKKTR